MLKKLRLRLTLLCIFMTGMVLAALTGAIMMLSTVQTARLNGMLFEKNIMAIVNRLQTEEAINPEWLARTEAGQKCVIAVENNGKSLRFRGVWRPENREDLLRRVRDAARERGLDYAVPMLGLTQEQRFFLLDGQYRCAVVRIPARENWFSLTVVADRADELALLRRQRIGILLLALAAFAVLCLLSRWFTGKAVRPAAQGMERQREFVASASHELRSPLALIETTASAIEAAPEQTRAFLKDIKAECGRMGRLINDLLLLANMDTASWRLQNASVDLTTVLLEVAEQYEDKAGTNGMPLTLELPEAPLPRIHGDAQRLEQVFTILLDNAISHSGSESLTVRAFRSGSGVIMEVIDHGKGVPPAEREKIFERFYRVDRSRADRDHFGLGLSVAKELVELHGGSIRLLETPGGGCTFQVAL